MTKKIYKYFSSDILPLAFQREGFCGIKCSTPSQYNDPYELFLGVDLNVSSDLLATYRDIIQDLPQHPTSCFSKLPTVAPMWAHYANNHSGFVLEFDVHQLKKLFSNIAIRDVDYKESASGIIEECLQRAAVTKKPRHAVWLQQAVLSEAYFSKHTAWSYEQECRLVDDNSYCENVAGNRILFVPYDCISSIVVGAKSPEELIESSKGLAKEIDAKWFQSVIGRSQSQPFFRDTSSNTAIFDGQGIMQADDVCESCSDPIFNSSSLCPWCSITDNDQINAARANPLRVLDHYGLLEEYYEGVRNIGGNG